MKSIKLHILTLSFVFVLAQSGCGETRPVAYTEAAFPAEKEKKAVSVADYRGPNAALAQKFRDARLQFDQGLLKLELAGKPNSDAIVAIATARASYSAIADDPTIDSATRAAAQHNVAMTYVVVRDYEKALPWISKAMDSEPSETIHGLEKNAIATGFYKKRFGYESREITAPTFASSVAPQEKDGIVTGVELVPVEALVTRYRTVIEPTGLIWVNDKKNHKVQYRETAELLDQPVGGSISARNATDRIVDVSKILVQVSANGKILAGDLPLAWNGDPKRLAPNTTGTASFSFGRPSQLPGTGSIIIKIIDVPATLDATGGVTAKRNDEFVWSLSMKSVTLDVENCFRTESLSPVEVNLGKTLLVERRKVPLVDAAPK